MKSIYILLTKSDTYISKIIKLTTSDTYTHVSISFDESLQPLYSFSRKFVRLPLPAGLREELLTDGFYKKYNYIPCALYELKVEDDVYTSAKQKVEQMMVKAPIYRFSVIGLVLCRFGIPFHRQHHYFCSEFVSKILNHSNALPLPKKPSLMRPNDFANMPGLTCLFEGQLCSLVERCNGLAMDL